MQTPRRPLLAAVAAATISPLALAPSAMAQSDTARDQTQRGVQRAGDQAAEPTDALSLILQAQGRWEGVLAYRDYQTDQRVEIPAAVEVSADEGGDRVIRRITYTDPGYAVRMTDITTVSEDGSTLRSASFSGRDIDVSAYAIASVTDLGGDGWRIVTLGEGTDNNQPVDERFTTTYSVDSLTQTKDVRPRGDADAEWAFRNEIVLDRVDATDASRLVGNWTIDLRPTPDAAPAPAPLSITSVEGGVIVGTFYGTRIEMSAINTDWGAVHFGYVTRDGSGPYGTLGTLHPDGTISGTTLSTGRNFLSVWTGTRDDE